MKSYGNWRLTSVEACHLVSAIIEGLTVPTPKPARSQLFDYHCHQLGLAFCGSRGESSYTRAATSLFVEVIRGTRLLEEGPHRTWKLVPFLLRLCRFHEQWCRSPEDWLVHPGDFERVERDGTVEAATILRSLIRHLFVRYEMPDFWDLVWFQEGLIDYSQMEWFAHVASGQSLRKANGIPLVLTKQASHEMHVAPPGLTVFKALRWGQLRALGVDREGCHQVLRTPAAVDFANDASLWLHLFQLLVRDPEFRAQVIPSVVDYLCLRRFGAANGAAYRMTRKNLRSLRREMAGYYRAHPELAWEDPREEQPRRRPAARKERIYNWPRMDGMRELDELDDVSVRWRLFELRRSYQLEIEGRRMRHCVGSYVGDCRQGSSSIWSLRSIWKETTRWEATIEVDRRTRTIVQVRGDSNRKPSRDAFEHVERWAERNRLRF